MVHPRWRCEVVPAPEVVAPTPTAADIAMPAELAADAPTPSSHDDGSDRLPSWFRRFELIVRDEVDWYRHRS